LRTLFDTSRISLLAHDVAPNCQEYGVKRTHSVDVAPDVAPIIENAASIVANCANVAPDVAQARMKGRKNEEGFKTKQN
jgi:hypothetical protein